MQKFLRKVFGIYPGEVKTTLLFVRFAIFWAFSTSCFETLADGLFLSYVGASNLPLAYLISALALMASSSIILYALRIKSPYQILCVTLSLFLGMSCLLLLLFSSYGLEEFPSIFWYILKIYSRIFFSVFLALAWTFIDQYHDLQDAKRVYSLYSAAYFLGLVLSGGCIHLFLDTLGQITFFTLTAISVFFALLSAKAIAHSAPAIPDDTAEGVFSGDRYSLSLVIRKLLKSPYTISLLALSLLQEFTITTTEYNYMETFEAAFQQGTLQKTFTANNISEFLGKYRAWISLANVFIGGALYRPFVKKLGLTNIVILPPLFFFLVYAGWVVQDSVPIAVLGLIAVEGVAFTIEDNSFNLLTKAVPLKLKSKVRIVNDSFFEPIGMIISSSLLLTLPNYQSRVFGLLLSFALIITTLILRSLYPKALFINLKEHILRFEKTLQQWTFSWTKRERKIAKETIRKELAATREMDKLFAIKSLLALQDKSVIISVIKEADTLSAQGKSQLITMLDASFCDRSEEVLEKITSWSNSKSEAEFCQKAYFYLAKRGLLTPKAVLPHLDGAHALWIRASAILTLKKTPNYGSLDEISLYRTISDREIDLLLGDKEKSEVLMGLRLLGEIPSVESAQKALTLFAHPDLSIRREAAHVLAKVADKSMYLFAEKLLVLLEEETDSKIRLYALEALGKIDDSSTVQDILLKTIHFRPVEKRFTEKIIAKMGLKNVPTILSLLKNQQVHDKPRILASKILARLSPLQLQTHLEEILEVEKKRAYFYFYYGHTIEKEYPSLDLKDLSKTLLTSFQSVIDFIIHLLGAVGQVEDPELFVVSLHSKNGKVKSSAIEALETTCSPHIFSWILPLLEDLPIEERLTPYQRYGERGEMRLSEVLQILQESPSTFDRIVAAKLKAKINIPNWKQELLQELQTCEENFHHFAYELLENETT